MITRRCLVAMLLVLMPLAAPGCGGDGGDGASGTATATTASAAGGTSVYFGWVLGTDEPTGIALEADPASGGGERKLRAYVCDGVGPPQGRAVWFGGSVDPEAVSADAPGAPIESAGKGERLVIDRFDERLVKGTFTDAEGKAHQFNAYPAIDGAGIYEVTLSEDLRYTGVSTAGVELEAQATKSGEVKGTVTTAAGEKLAFTIRTLALAPPAELEASGLSRTYGKDRARSLVPGEYVAVVAPSSSHWLGRSGNVRKGSPGDSIIGLDKKD